VGLFVQIAFPVRSGAPLCARERHGARYILGLNFAAQLRRFNWARTFRDILRHPAGSTRPIFTPLVTSMAMGIGRANLSKNSSLQRDKLSRRNVLNIYGGATQKGVEKRSAF
jgi:hypothetical protein